jgi:hypothetical protein
MTVRELMDALSIMNPEARVVVDLSANEWVDGEVVESDWEGDRVVRGVDEIMVQNGTPFVHIMGATFKAPSDIANLSW